MRRLGTSSPEPVSRDACFARRPAGRFLSAAECTALAQRVIKMAIGGGETAVFITSSWSGHVAWGRNQITTCGDVRDNNVAIARSIRGAVNGFQVSTNQLDDASLEAAVRRAERLLIGADEDLEAPLAPSVTEPYQLPPLWFERTYQLDAAARAAAMRTAVEPARAAGLTSAGYLAVSAHGEAAFTSEGRSVYIPYTQAQCSMTVRDPAGTASGWAGVDWNDWGQVDVAQLAATAVAKCVASRNPVALEPGRYTVILEPQAVSDIIAPIFDYGNILYRGEAEQGGSHPFAGLSKGQSKIGERVIDARLTLSADPMDPLLGFVPITAGFGTDMPVYHPVTWIANGVLQNLWYERDPYAIQALGLPTGLPNSGAFRLSGGPTAVAEMIATTKRGLLVTRFSGVEMVHEPSVLLSGYTRDGLWLIEDGKVSKPVKNFRFVASPLVALNRVVQIGPAQRVFRPRAPAVVPPLKVEDFPFTTLVEAV